MGDLYYYFASKDRRLRYGDNRLIEEGVTHTVEPSLDRCDHALHAYRRAIDALRYAHGPVICTVELGGEILHGDTRSIATKRTYLEVIDGESLISKFCRRCDLDTLELWERLFGGPGSIRSHLGTGNWGMREYTWHQAWDAPRAAAGAAFSAASSISALERATRGTTAPQTTMFNVYEQKMEEYNGWLEQMIADKIKEDRND